MAEEREISLGYCECLSLEAKDLLVDLIKDAFDTRCAEGIGSWNVGKNVSLATHCSELRSLFDSIEGTPVCNTEFLIRKLEKEINDESGARNAYGRLAEVADMIGEKTLADKIRDIAYQEGEHKTILTNAVEALQIPESVGTTREWPGTTAGSVSEQAKVVRQHSIIQQGEIVRQPNLSRPFPKTYDDWKLLTDDIIKVKPTLAEEAKSNLQLIAMGNNHAKMWLVDLAGELGVK
jgi:hypothetical protein